MLKTLETRKLSLLLPGIGVVVSLLWLAAPCALADTVSIDLYAYQGNQRGAYLGDVTLTLNQSGGIDVSVNLSPGYGLWGHDAFGFNVVGSTTGLNVTNLTNGFTWNASNTNTQVGGYGVFQYMIQGPNGAAHALSGLHFTVTRTGGFTSVSQLISLSSGGGAGQTYLYFIAHGANVPGVGAVYLGGTTPDLRVPEPGTIVLLGLGLAAVGVLKWRFSQ